MARDGSLIWSSTDTHEGTCCLLYLENTPTFYTPACCSKCQAGAGEGWVILIRQRSVPLGNVLSGSASAKVCVWSLTLLSCSTGQMFKLKHESTWLDFTNASFIGWFNTGGCAVQHWLCNQLFTRRAMVTALELVVLAAVLFSVVLTVAISNK